jgi:hypothetical protein
MIFDPLKPSLTRCGYGVEILRILTTPTYLGESIIALVHGRNGASVETYDADGNYFRDRRASPWDLVNLPPTTRTECGATAAKVERADA